VVLKLLLIGVVSVVSFVPRSTTARDSTREQLGHRGLALLEFVVVFPSNNKRRCMSCIVVHQFYFEKNIKEVLFPFSCTFSFF
jgi:hypothetical protein